MERSTRLRYLIRNYREARGLTQRELAQRIGLPRLLYWRIEANKRRLRKEEFAAVCSVLGVDREALLREAGYAAFIEER